MKKQTDHIRHGLSRVLASPALARLVLHFALHGEEPWHVRALQRITGLSMSSLVHELERLEEHQLVRRSPAGRRVKYRAALFQRRWGALRALIREFADPQEVVQAALSTVAGIEAAFVFGSFARGDARDDSDVDVLGLGDSVSAAALGRATAEASVLLGRPVELRSYTREKLAQQLSAGNAVLRRILDGPKRWIVGDEHHLQPVAASSSIASTGCWRAAPWKWCRRTVGAVRDEPGGRASSRTSA